MLDHVPAVTNVYRARPDCARPLAVFLSRVPAGFPSPADDYVEQTLDLNEYLIRREASTFLVRVSGHSMTNASIHDGDILVVDRAEEPTDGAVVVAALDGELTVKRYRIHEEQPYLVPESDDHAPPSHSARTGPRGVGRGAARDSRGVVRDERVFTLSQRNQLMVVRSNTDGCVIARSWTTKDTGVPMEALLVDDRADVMDAAAEQRRPATSDIKAEAESYATPLHVLSRDSALVGRFRAHGPRSGLQPSPTADSLHHAGVYSMLVRALTVHNRDLRGQPVRPAPSYRPRGVGRSALLPRRSQ